MCGIAGFVLPRQSNAEWGDKPQVLRRMTRPLSHRGPDDEGLWSKAYVRGASVHLGHRRLSIIDLAGGHQPLVTPDDSLAVVFNGEIYNFVELREELEGRGHVFRTRSDTEVLLWGFREWGPGLLEKLNGMFAFALWDADERRLVLARDRMGQKPLYWALRDGGLLFGSELRSLLEHPRVDRKVSPQSLVEYLLYDSVPAPRSMIDGVHKLPAGTWLEWKDGELQPPKPYWDIRFGTPERGPTSDSIHRGWQTISDSVRLRLRSDVPLGLFLSGGIDSTAVLVAMAEHMPAGEIQTFSIGFDDPSYDESAPARMIANHVGATHHERVLSPNSLHDVLDPILAHLDEPLADPSILPTYLLSSFAREKVKVALGGDGGDEIWLGYPTFVAHRVARVLERMPRFARSTMEAAVQTLPVSTSYLSFDYKAKRLMQGMRYSPFCRHFVWIGAATPPQQERLLSRRAQRRGVVSDVFEPVNRHTAAAQPRNDYDLLSYLYAKLYLGDDVLTKVDRASMAVSLEVRAPLLDHRVVDFAASLRTADKLRFTTTKYLLKKMLHGRVPDSILNRKKQGFGVPIAAWLNGPLKGWADDLLSPERLEAGGFFSAPEVGRWLSEHREGRADNRKVLWSLVVFNRWCEAHEIAPLA